MSFQKQMHYRTFFLATILSLIPSNYSLSQIEQNSSTPRPTSQEYNQGMSFQEIRAQYEQALQQAIKDARTKKNQPEIRKISEELKRIGSREKEVRRYLPSQLEGWSREGIAVKGPPFYLEGNLNRGINLTFKDSELTLLDGKKVYLVFQTPPNRNAGTRDNIEVYYNNNLIGLVKEAEENSTTRVELNSKKLPKVQELKLTLKTEGGDQLIIDSPEKRALQLEVETSR